MVQPAGQQRWTRSRYPLHSSLFTDARPNRVDRPSPDQYPEKAHVSTRSELQSPVNKAAKPQEAPRYLSNHTQDDDSTRSNSTSRSASPSSTMSASSIKYHIAATMNPDDENQGETHQPSVDEPGRRTLRRTPRSRRIEARISLADMDAAAAQAERKEETSKTAAEGGDTTLHKSVQKDKTLPASPPSSDSGSDHSSTAPSSQDDKRKPPADVTKMWQHRTYPLQAPASHGDLRRPPTPPSPTPIRKQQSETSHGQLSQSTLTTGIASSSAQPLQSAPPVGNSQHSSPASPVSMANAASTPQSEKAVPSTPSKKKTLGRNAYPLQSPVSISDLRQSSPSSSSSPQSPTSEPATSQAASAVLSNGKTASVATNQRGLSRQTYPLQSPASIANLPDSKNEPERGSQEATNQVPAKHIAGPGNKTMRRTRYPLQSPASNTNLRHASSASGHTISNSAGEQEGGAHADGSSSGPRRQGYPLQSAANGSSMHQSPASPRRENQATAVQGWEESQSTGPRGFRRQKYPLSSSTAGASTLRSPPSYPSVTATSHTRPDEEEPSSNNSPPPPVYSPPKRVESGKEAVLIPKNIRGCKDSERHLNGRTIVICLDGTGDKFDDDNSNIVHIVSALKKDDAKQVTYYQAGIGTYNDGGLSSGFAAAADMAVGSGLGLHIRDAYHFLMHSYKEGDRICIFGFSRGAYTARCLAGMIHKVGLLPPRNIQQIQFAYEFYKSDTAEGWKQSEDFKRAFSIDVNVYFLGCFDSVDSVGFIPRQLPLSSTPLNKAHYFRHAIALDERRAKFKVCRYQSAKKQGQLEKVKTFNEETDAAISKALDRVSRPKAQDDHPPQYSSDVPFGREHHPNLTNAEYKSLSSHDEDFDTDVSEVWFTGCHADVGGGAVANVERHKLAQIPLRWMIRQAFECDTGIIFKTRFLAEYGLDVHTLWPKYSRLPVPKTLNTPPADYLSKYEKALPPRTIRRGKLVPIRRRGEEHVDHHGEPFFHLSSQEDEDWTPEQVEDYYDAMSPMNDQLVQAPSWWILETIPVQYKISTKPGEVKIVTGPNMGLARLVEDWEAQVHWTVVQRAHQMGYKPAARPAMHTEWRVVT